MSCFHRQAQHLGLLLLSSLIMEGNRIIGLMSHESCEKCVCIIFFKSN
jgi:hypothetical protein